MTDENALCRKRAIQCLEHLKIAHPDLDGEALLIEIYERGYVAGMGRAHQIERGRLAESEKDVLL